MQMHRQEDRGMFSQCFCELATQVAEMLCQHLSLLDSKKWTKGTDRRREIQGDDRETQKKTRGWTKKV